MAASYVARYCDILHRNWKHGRREIDIIARKDDRLYFIEVKTRNGDRYGWPEQAVDEAKLARIQEVATLYMQQYGLTPKAIRFDIISIIFYGDEQYGLLHLKDVG